MKRKTFLINRDFQLRIINFIAFLYVIISLMFYLANYILIQKIYNFGIESKIPSDNIYFSFVKELRYYGSLYYFIVFLIGILVIYTLGFILSHRIAGPVYKVTKTLDKIISESDDNKRSEIKFTTRSTDYFPELAEKMNELTEFYEKRLNEKK